jgi:hypothetical protein
MQVTIPIFRNAIENDKEYRKRLQKFARIQNSTESTIIDEVRNRLEQTSFLSDFSRTLQEIDFSRFVQYVLEELNLPIERIRPY